MESRGGGEEEGEERGRRRRKEETKRRNATFLKSIVLLNFRLSGLIIVIEILVILVLY